MRRSAPMSYVVMKIQVIATSVSSVVWIYDRQYMNAIGTLIPFLMSLPVPDLLSEALTQHEWKGYAGWQRRTTEDQINIQRVYIFSGTQPIHLLYYKLNKLN